MATGKSAARRQGAVAACSSGSELNPVLMGVMYQASPCSAADGDVYWALGDASGRQEVIVRSASITAGSINVMTAASITAASITAASIDVLTTGSLSAIGTLTAASITAASIDVLTTGSLSALGTLTAASITAGSIGELTNLATFGSVAPQWDDTDKLAVSLYGSGSAGTGDTALQTVDRASKGQALKTSVVMEGNQYLSDAFQLGDGVDGNRILMVAPWAYNGASFDRQRSNSELTVLASAARTATTNSSDQTNRNHRGMVLAVDITARAAATTLTPNLQVKESVGSNYITIWTAAAALNSSDTTVAYLLYPSPLADAAELYTEAVDITFGRTWRLAMTHGDTDSITYSVAAAMIL